MNSLHLLLIEEHEAVRQALATRFASVPAIRRVTTAAQAGEALANIARDRPDVVLFGLDGSHSRHLQHEVATIKQLTAQKIPVMIITPYADDVERELLLQAGAQRYCLQHINTPELIAEIEAMVALS